MNDPFPKNITIDIDRDRLRTYLRAKWFLSWLGSLAGLGALLGFMAVLSFYEKRAFGGFPELCGLLIRAGAVLLGSLVVACLLYFLLSHWLAAQVAGGLQVSVEGPFLRIRQHRLHRMDRKVHFRAIIDYTIVEGALMRRFGIMALRMTTAAPPIHGIPEIAGIKDCPRVRDMLAEIDSLRENS